MKKVQHLSHKTNKQKKTTKKKPNNTQEKQARSENTTDRIVLL